MSLFKNKKSGFTLMEIAIAVLIVAILVGVTIPVVRRQLNKSDEYSYYLAYKTVEKLGGQIAALGDPNFGKISSKVEPKIKLASLPAAKFYNKYSKQKKSHPMLARLSKNLANAELRIFKVFFPKAFADYTVTSTLFDSDEITDIYQYYEVCVQGNNELIKGYDENEEPIYYTYSELCQSDSSSHSTAEDGESFTNSQMLDNRLLILLNNDNYCFKQEKICNGLDTSSDTACDNAITNSKNNAISALRNAIALHHENAGSYICNNIVKNYCIGTTSYNETQETVIDDGEDDDDVAGTIGQCQLSNVVEEEPVVTPSNTSWYPDPAPSCESLGYVNTFNNAPYTTTTSGTAQANNDCQCYSGFSWSENNSKACCLDSTSGLSYYIGTGCLTCTTDFNPTTKKCCKDYSRYDASTGTCKCLDGYEGDGDTTGCERGNSCPAGMKYEASIKKCVPAPPLIDAQRFCELIVDNWNISSSYCNAFTALNNSKYYKSVYDAAYNTTEKVLNSIKGAEGAFKSIKPNIVFSNGLRLWILGDRAASIPGLSYDSTNAVGTQNMCINVADKVTQDDCSEVGEYFCASEYHCMKLASTSSLADARNCCASPVSVDEDADNRTMALSGFTVYVDINGTQGDGTLWKDVFPFYITTTGRVFPAYPLDAASAHVGGHNPAYLPTDVYYYKSTASSRKRVVAYSSVSYAEAVCRAGMVNPYSPYCYNLGVTAGTNPCSTITDDDDDATQKYKCFISVRRKNKLL